MPRNTTRLVSLFFSISGLFLFLCSYAAAQDSRVQYPGLLRNSYFGIHAGSIRYPFSNNQLQAGLRAESVDVPHLAVRAFLFGHEFNRYFSAQLSYMRPVEWVKYRNVDGDAAEHSVWTNVASVTVKPQLPLSPKISIYGEAGLAIVTRKGFSISGSPAVADYNRAGFLAGGGIAYNWNDRWSLTSGVVSAAGNSEFQQPRTTFFSGGLNYTMRPLQREVVERNSDSDLVFPENIIQIGYSSSAAGFGANDLVSKSRVPVFWAGDVLVGRGISVNYQRNAFHTRRMFSLDWGAGVSTWKSQKIGDHFVTAALYPVFEFTALRSHAMDIYFRYSLAGPAYISRPRIDGVETGKHFTFQDFMGVGFFAGGGRKFNTEVRIVHYSNGNIFPHNPGITVPLNLNLGYTF